ncbi:hypothetical protein HBI56_123370 [Parastagonospora nodorum]|nr:hypothetical protein HBI10_149050 [Parastagonospora nodorum]KAH4020105.1 hypothetical protein HBI13_122190 [Parastagonospora nodorum]KAH4076683.1 hypothetical protein HBH50_009040 [Parastagonospora nodorum]KAH4095833.1 hypothetical protein HBH48_048710 [Parastagonospora nodorum]KAH4169561.1 hypothetical protein HBH43_119160 [Parastagonospora nodorum]
MIGAPLGRICIMGWNSFFLRFPLHAHDEHRIHHHFLHRHGSHSLAIFYNIWDGNVDFGS